MWAFFVRLAHALVRASSIVVAGSLLISCTDAGEQSGTRVTGVVDVRFGAAVDSDVNNPLAGQRFPNDSPSTAQRVLSPIVLGGFVTKSGTGNPGDVFENESDPLDVYRVHLSVGDTITLSISDHNSVTPPQNDIDLLLFAHDDADSVIASSVGLGPVEAIHITQSIGGDRQYDVVVKAVSGTSNYVLTIDEGGGQIESDHLLRIEDDFIADEVIVKLKDSGLEAQAHAHDPVLAGLVEKRGSRDRSLLLEFADDLKREQILFVHDVTGDPGSEQYGPRNEEQIARYETIKLLGALRAHPEVLTADLNYRRQITLVPDDTLFPFQWHYPQIHLPEAWEVTQGDPAVVVAVIDTGVDLDHPDLANVFTATGYDFISQPTSAADGDGIDPDASDPGDNPMPGLSSFHGTHVAGTIASATNNSMGVAGASWFTRIMPLRALGVGGGTSYDIIQAARYAAGMSNDSGIVLPSEERARIINLSLGGSRYSQWEQEEYAAIRDSGVLIVAAAGNNGTNQRLFPASYDSVVSVSAVDRYKQRPMYSQFGLTLDIAAPGGWIEEVGGRLGGVYSTWVDDSSGVQIPAYHSYQGTSMSCAHVTAVAALMNARYPGMTPVAFDSLVATGQMTEDLGEPGWDNYFGYGLIDAARAVAAADALNNGESLPRYLQVAPRELNFSTFLSELDLVIENGNSQALNVGSVASNRSWLSVSHTSVDSEKLGTYTVKVDRKGLTDGVYSGDILLSVVDAGIVRVPVTMTVSGVGDGADVGYQFIALLNPVTYAPIAVQGAEGASGRYQYSFDGIEAGGYLLAAGTDLDNDGFICDAGEACGVFPDTSAWRMVEVGAGEEGALDFSSQFGDSSISMPAQGFSRIVRR